MSRLSKFAISSLVLMLVCIHAYGSPFGAKTQKEVLISDSPFVYLVGTVEGGKVFKYHGDVITTVQIQPHGASQIYDRSMTFCDNRSDEFKDKTDGLLVITYERVMHRSMCYDLLDVRPVGER